MRNQLISGIINSVIRKKEKENLEKIMWGIMTHPEDIPEDISEHIEIARKYGFWDIVEGFDLIDSEIGKIQRERTIQKKRNERERELKESQFRDYLVSHPEKAEGMETGLHNLRAEIPIKSGRIDINVSDKEKNDVRLELKARDYDSIDTHVKIKKYLYVDDTKKSRVFFAAPEVKPDLFFSLRDLQEQGRVRFFEYDFDFEKQEYCNFREIKANDFKEPKKIPWERIKKERVDNGLIRVTTAAEKQEIKPKRKPLEEVVSKVEAKEEAKEEKGGVLKKISDVLKESANDFKEKKILPISREEWDSYPFYYQIILLTRDNLKDKDKYLNPIEVNEEQYQELLKLTYSDDEKKVYKFLEEYVEIDKRCSDKVNKFGMRGMSLRFVDRNTKRKIFGYQKKFRTPVQSAHNTMEFCRKSIDEDPQRCFSELEKRIKEIEEIEFKQMGNKRVNEFLQSVLDGRAQLSVPDELADYVALKTPVYANVVEPSMVKMLMQKKLSRTKEFMKIDKDLAYAYLSLDLGDLKDTKVLKIDGSNKVRIYIGPEELYSLMTADFQFYNGVLNNLKVIEKPKEPEVSKLEERIEEKKEVIKKLIDTVKDATEEFKRSEKGEKLISQEDLRFNTKEEYEKWKSYPLYYKALCLLRSDLKNKEKYLESIEIENFQMRGLERLLNPSDIVNSLNELKSNLDSFLSIEESHDFLSGKKIIFPSSEKDIVKWFERSSSYYSKTISIIKDLFESLIRFGQDNKESYETNKGKLKALQNKLNSLVIEGKYHNKDLAEYRNCLENLRLSGDIIGLNDEELKKYVRSLLFPANFYNDSMVNEFFKTKINRTNNLMNINKELGIMYLCFNPRSIQFLFDLEKKSALYIDLIDNSYKIISKIELTPESIYDFIQKDQELYQSILSNFRVKESPQSKLEQISQSAPGVQNAPQSTYETPPQQIEHKNGPVKTKVHYGYPVSAVIPNKAYEALHPDKQTIVNEFVEEVLNNPDYSQKIKKKYSTLARQSNWYKGRKDEVEIRDFFYDLKMQIDKESSEHKNNKHK